MFCYAVHYFEVLEKQYINFVDQSVNQVERPESYNFRTRRDYNLLTQSPAWLQIYSFFISHISLWAHKKTNTQQTSHATTLKRKSLLGLPKLFRNTMEIFKVSFK